MNSFYQQFEKTKSTKFFDTTNFCKTTTKTSPRAHLTIVFLTLSIQKLPHLSREIANREIRRSISHSYTFQKTSKKKKPENRLVRKGISAANPSNHQWKGRSNQPAGLLRLPWKPRSRWMATKRKTGGRDPLIFH